MSDPSILLLGGGYTLLRTAELLPAGSFVITSRNAETRRSFESKGWLATDFNIELSASLPSVLGRWPSITTVVDSVPPIRTNDNPLIGAEAVSHAVQKGGIKRLLYLSTTGVYGVTDGSWVDENTPTNPTQVWGRDRLHAENIYREMKTVEVSIFRLPAIYGPGRGLEQALQLGSYKLIDNGERWTNRIHVDDLAGVLAEGATTERSIPEIVCVTDDKPVLQREIVEAYCRKLNLPMPSSVSSEQAKDAKLFTMLSNQRISNALMKKSFAWKLKFSSYEKHLEVI